MYLTERAALKAAGTTHRLEVCKQPKRKDGEALVLRNAVRRTTGHRVEIVKSQWRRRPCLLVLEFVPKPPLPTGVAS